MTVSNEPTAPIGKMPNLQWETGGLTKREYFAACALIGFSQSYGHSPLYAAEHAVQAADHLIEALNRKAEEAKLETFHAHTLPTPGESD